MHVVRVRKMQKLKKKTSIFAKAERGHGKIQNGQLNDDDDNNNEKKKDKKIKCQQHKDSKLLI